MCKIVTVGEMVKDRINKSGWSMRDFSMKMGIPEGIAKKLILDHVRIDEEYASRLFRVIGGSPEFWAALDEFNERMKKREKFYQGSLRQGQKVLSFCNV